MLAGLIHFIIGTGKYKGVFGEIGRAYGRNYGCPVFGDLRIIIDKPDEFIQHELFVNGIYEPGIIEVIRGVLKPNDVVFDIGANIGYISIFCARLGGVVHAFEPVPRLASRIKQNALLNNLSSSVYISETAISNKNSSEILYVAERKDDGSHSLLPGVPAKKVQEIQVKTITLDDYIASSSYYIPQLIKIDVEGYEAYVLDGAVNVLSSQAPPIFIIETGDRLSNQLHESAKTVLQRFYRLSYRVFKIQDCAPFLLEVSADEINGGLADYLAISTESDRLSLIDVMTKNY